MLCLEGDSSHTGSARRNEPISFGATRPYSQTRPRIWFSLIDQSTRVELAINLRITKTLAVKMPQLLLLRADEVIQ